jgi:hypothetical protein
VNQFFPKKIAKMGALILIEIRFEKTKQKYM